MSHLPTLVLSLAFLTAAIAGTRYWERTQQQDLKITDAGYLARLDPEERRHYSEYREHDVSPEAAVQWVREERELADLKRVIDRRDHTRQTGFRPRTLREYGDTIPLRRTVSY
jgi:hypothetical protein